MQNVNDCFSTQLKEGGGDAINEFKTAAIVFKLL